MEQTDEKLAGETGHVCVLTSGANIADFERNNSACVPLIALTPFEFMQTISPAYLLGIS